MEKIPFKERVKNIAIACAVKYRNTFCNYEYLIISNAFTEKHVKIHADKDNYMHLLGVNSNLSASDIECQQNFSKGKVSCSFASASNKYTIGFVATGRPMTLMKNNQLAKDKSKPVIAMLRKEKGPNTFNDIIYGDIAGYENIVSKINQQ